LPSALIAIPSEPIPAPCLTDPSDWLSKNGLPHTIGRNVCKSSALVEGWS